MTQTRLNLKSQKLTPAELAALRKFYKQSDPKVAAAQAIGLSRAAIENTISRGTCTLASLEKIRAALSLNNITA